MCASALVVMAKAPMPGSVKTRLHPALNPEQGAQFARALLIDQLNHLRQFASADLYIAFTPGETRSLMEELAPPPFTLFPQQGHDLGARMQAVFEKLFSAGHSNIVLIGGDLAAVPLHFIEQAFCFLDSGQQRVALGPSRDGGYYLVGCNRSTPELFCGMKWSHHAVLAETLSKLGALKIAYDLLPAWFDIDTPDDLRILRMELNSPALARAMPETIKLLSHFDSPA